MNRLPLNYGLTLAETIREIGSERAVVAIDEANTGFWARFINENALSGEKVGDFSTARLALELDKIKAVKEKYLFAVHYDFDKRSIVKILEIIMGINPMILRRAEVENKGDVFEYQGKYYDLELVFLTAQDLINMESEKFDEVKHFNDYFRSKVHSALLHFNSIRYSKKREKEGYRVVPIENRVFSNFNSRMAEVAEIAMDIRDKIDLGMSHFDEVEIDEEQIESISNHLHLADEKLREFERIGLPVDEIFEALKNARNLAKSIFNIAKSDQLKFVGKANVDAFLVAELMDKAVLESSDTFVVFSGDGDFRLMYDKMLEAKKKVVVVSPAETLSKDIGKMADEGRISLVNPKHDKNLWTENKRR